MPKNANVICEGSLTLHEDFNTAKKSAIKLFTIIEKNDSAQEPQFGGFKKLSSDFKRARTFHLNAVHKRCILARSGF
jgi:hypothetical protein